MPEWVEEVGAPLPNISDHVEEPKAVGGKGVDGSNAGVAIISRVPIRETALPDIA
jgi:hypothetical protein